MSSSSRRLRLPHVSRTIGRIAAWNAAAMVVLYVLFNFFLLLLVDFVLEENLDARIEHELEHVSKAFILREAGVLVTHPEEFEETDMAEITERSIFVQLYRLDGSMLVQSPNLDDLPALAPQINVRSDTEHSNETWFGVEWRVGYRIIEDDAGAPAGILRLGTRKTGLGDALERIYLFDLLTFPFVFVGIILIGVYTAKRGLQPLTSVIDLAQRISTTSLTERLQYDALPDDELGKLRDTLNELFDRLQAEVNRINEFTQNASHQLMTPLTAIRTEIDYLLLKTRTPRQYQLSLRLLRDRADDLRAMVETLLMLARESDTRDERKSLVNVPSTISDTILPSYPYVTYSDGKTDHAYVIGRPQYLAMMLKNLIENAEKYGSPKEAIGIALSVNDSSVRIDVFDGGPGIPERDREKVFERFFRGSQTDAMPKQGFGLGLGLVKAFVLSMNGSIRLEDNTPTGSRFVITLPRARVE